MIRELEKFEKVVFRLEFNVLMGDIGLNFDNLVPQAHWDGGSAKR